jgi:quercetin dioxygenase-like cupin family protein
MALKEIYSNSKYRVLEVNLKAGEKMPLHEATSDAFVIPKKGKGRVSFSDRNVEIGAGESLLIKAHDPHQMEILEDFTSCIILENDGQINFVH